MVLINHFYFFRNIDIYEVYLFVDVFALLPENAQPLLMDKLGHRFFHDICCFYLATENPSAKTDLGDYFLTKAAAFGNGYPEVGV